MSGKAQFDERAVIGAAVNVFWRHGFTATSISDLTAATGLSRSSLYQRFGDKDGLFQEALAAYTETLLRHMDAVDAETARGRLASMLRAYVRAASDEYAPPPGCLLARCCTELAELSEGGRSLAQRGLARQHALLAGIVREGMRRGELAASADADALAWHFLATLQALVTLPQAGASKEHMRALVEVAMSVWPPL